MKKLCLLVFGFVSLLPMVGRASFLRNDAYECAVDNDGTDWFWYCGKQSRSCRGIRQGDRDHYVLLTGADDYSVAPPVCSGDPKPCPNYDKKAVHHESEAFVCCGGTGDHSGKLLSYDPNNWLTEQTEDISGIGLVTYYKNPCGTVFHYEFQDGGQIAVVKGKYMSCTAGRIIFEQEGKSVTRCTCPNGEGFDGAYSSECVSCATTTTQGVDKNGVCVRCSNNQLFKADSSECSGQDCCVTKNELPIVQHASFEWCYRCNQDKDLWLRCLSGHLGEKWGAQQQADDKDFENCGIKTKTNIPSNLKVNL